MRAFACIAAARGWLIEVPTGRLIVSAPLAPPRRGTGKCGAEPVRVKEVHRAHLIELLLGQIVGNAATLAMAAPMSQEELEELPQSIALAVDHFIAENRERFDEKLGRAEQRYRFVD